jgi:hypothetical protein
MFAPATRRLLLRTKRLLPVSMSLAFAVSCSDSTPFDVGSPLFEVVALSSSSTAFGLEQTDVSILFLFEQDLGNLPRDPVVSLVMIHDKRAPSGDGKGGTATFEYDGIPSGATYVVRDDSGEPLPEGSNLNTVESFWEWNQFNTDGGAVSPLGTGFEITITPSFPVGGLEPDYQGQIQAWKFLSGMNGTTVSGLDRTKPIKIRRVGSS